MKPGLNTGISDFSQRPFPVARSSKRTFGTHTVPRSLDPVGTPLPPPQPKPKPKQRRQLKPKQKTKQQRRPKHQKRPKTPKQRM